MLRTICRFVCVLAVLLPMGAAAPMAQSGARTITNDEWCDDALRNNDNDDREQVCEVRELTLPRGSFSAETSNGSMRVTGEDRNDIVVRALVMAHARTMERAREVLKEVTLTAASDGTVTSRGPRGENRAGWWVSYRIQAPKTTDLKLRSSNGSLTVTGVKGDMTLRTSNGSIKLTDVAGDVEADTSNGSVTTSLSGSKWDGAGLSVTTSNGSVRLEVPSEFNAHLLASTSNGHINVDFPITVRGRIGRELETDLGSGGAPIKMRTSNGSVRIERK